ncbi:MAG: hypothetical protein ACOCVW_00495 [bacterium]
MINVAEIDAICELAHDLPTVRALSFYCYTRIAPCTGAVAS